MADRLDGWTRTWGVHVQRTIETPTSLVAFGLRGDRPVVLKVVRHPGDEWRSGDVLRAFRGNGVVRALGHVPGAVLLERLTPGTPLVDLVADGRDEAATAILAGVMARMAPSADGLEAFTPVREWGSGFDRHLAGGDERIPAHLVEHGRREFAALCDSQRDVRLLHGDLQHYNVLFDDDRGWVAIDPKGVVGEHESEVGPSLRNPIGQSELYASPRAVERRLGQYGSVLRLDAERMLRWAFAQAVLSAIWSIEDGYTVDDRDPAMLLAQTTGAMLGLLA